MRIAKLAPHHNMSFNNHTVTTNIRTNVDTFAETRNTKKPSEHIKKQVLQLAIHNNSEGANCTWNSLEDEMAGPYRSQKIMDQSIFRPFRAKNGT